MNGLILGLLIVIDCLVSRPITSVDINKEKIDSFPLCSLGVIKGKTIEIVSDVDLKGKKCLLPDSCKLQFKGGIISNGTLVGHQTTLKGEGVFFDHVKFKGLWNVPVIKSSMFRNLNYNNSLKDVLALTNPQEYNIVILDNEKYPVSALTNNDACISICSNTKIVLYGVILLDPNEYSHYNIIRAEGNNIEITGTGSIVGDRFSHLGKSGEWGMGICVIHATDVKISGLNISDCWGDCLYVGGESSDLLIEKCNINRGRRQGISITSAEAVRIKDCHIRNICGTNPEYAIDIEPNRGDTVKNVRIENVRVENCKGGFLAYGRAEEAAIVSIFISNCNVSGVNKPAINIIECSNVSVTNCHITQLNKSRAVNCDSIDKLVINNNILQKYCANGDVFKGEREAIDNISDYIILSNCDNQTVTNNSELR